MDIDISDGWIFGETIERVGNMAQGDFIYVIQVDGSFSCKSIIMQNKKSKNDCRKSM